MDPIRVAVVEDQEIFRRGLVVCLRDDASVKLMSHDASGPVDADVDVVVASAGTVQSEAFHCPVVVFTARGDTAVGAGLNKVQAVLDYSSATPQQLVAAIHAAAAGLSIDPGTVGDRVLADRSVEVLRMLADGAETKDIALSLGYSERTIKSLIQDLERQLGARNRAQAVAHGIRLGII